MIPASAHTASLLDHITDLVVAIDAAGNITYINKAGLQLSGTDDASALTGKPLRKVFPSFDKPSCRLVLEEARRTAQPATCEKFDDNFKDWYELTVYPYEDGLILFMRNSSSRREFSDQIINSMPGIFYLADTSPRLIRWNHTLETITGYSPAELAAMIPIDLFDTRDHPAFKTAMAQALTEGSANVEAQLITKSGKRIPFYFTGVKIEYNGQPAMLGTGIDMTSQKTAADELRKSSERYFLTTKATNDMIWDWNLLTNDIWWNYNYNNLFGFDDKTVKHHISSWMETIHPEDRERVVKGIYKVINSGEKYWTDDYRYLMNDGRVLFIYDRGYVLHDENGKPYRMIGSMLDITDRIKTELALREKEERYRNLFERAGDSIVVHDMSGLILDVNEAAVAYSGFSKEELLRMKVSDLLFTEDLEKTPVPWDQLVAGETTFNRRRVKTRSGITRIMEVSSKQLPDGNVMAMIRDVTERSEAEKALRVSERRFRALADNVPVGIFETNADGDTIYINGKMQEYSGLSFDELLKNGWVKCIHPDDREELVQQWQANLAARRESPSEYRIIAPDGTMRWVQGKAVPVYDRNGDFNGYLGTVSDITIEKLALIALRKSEEKYRTLVEQASDAIYIVNTEGRLVTVNPSAVRMSGYSEEELLKMSIYDFVSPEDLADNPLRFDELKQKKQVVVERRFRLKHDKTMEVECLANLLSDGRILVFARDISERIRQRNEIIKEKNLSDSIINSLPGVFYLFDEAGHFIRWNKNLEFVSGFSAGEIGHMSPVDFFGEDEKEIIRQSLQDAFVRGTADVEAHFLTKNNERIPYYFNGWRIVFEGRPCLIGVGIDITEKRKAEELLRLAYEDTRRLASHLTRVREEERKRIGREIHDELGQQLTAIKMDMAWIDKKTDPENEAIKNKIRNVIGLLDSSNLSVRRILTELSPGIVDNRGLPAALERLNDQFAGSTGIPVHFELSDKTVDLSQDIANCIFRVYQESLTNIMRYARATKVVTSLKIRGDTITVAISDDGIGFDTQKLLSKTSFGILGMKERVESQQGTIEIRSVQGKGTTITAKLPYRS